MERHLHLHTSPLKITINAYLRSFQYKILNNVLYLKKKLYLWLIKHRFMFFLQNGRRDSKATILLLFSYAKYLESSSSIFRWLLAFFTVITTDSHFWLSWYWLWHFSYSKSDTALTETIYIKYQKMRVIVF